MFAGVAGRTGVYDRRDSFGRVLGRDDGVFFAGARCGICADLGACGVVAGVWRALGQRNYDSGDLRGGGRDGGQYYSAAAVEESDAFERTFAVYRGLGRVGGFWAAGTGGGADDCCGGDGSVSSLYGSAGRGGYAGSVVFDHIVLID